ncbi:MAG TPA: GNAT family N-acetyltransferase [Rhodobacteraceae bacterium]|nr:GNAT family N-acetyltransferase [Paracoccaceae bacterium]
MSVTLAPLPPDAHDRVRHLEVADSQLDFVAAIEQMLGEPTPGVDFHGISTGDEAVGFFKIDPPGVSCFDFVAADALGLRGLLVGAQYQGKGYGGAAMAALPAYLRARYDAPRAMLSVDDSNPVAHRLYLAHGWVDTGELHHGRAGPAPVLQLTL